MTAEAQDRFTRARGRVVVTAGDGLRIVYEAGRRITEEEKAWFAGDIIVAMVKGEPLIEVLPNLLMRKVDDG